MNLKKRREGGGGEGENEKMHTEIVRNSDIWRVRIGHHVLNVLSLTFWVVDIVKKALIAVFSTLDHLCCMMLVVKSGFAGNFGANFVCL